MRYVNPCAGEGRSCDLVHLFAGESPPLPKPIKVRKLRFLPLVQHVDGICRDSRFEVDLVCVLNTQQKEIVDAAVLIRGLG